MSEGEIEEEKVSEGEIEEEEEVEGEIEEEEKEVEMADLTLGRSARCLLTDWAASASRPTLFAAVSHQSWRAAALPRDVVAG